MNWTSVSNDLPNATSVSRTGKSSRNATVTICAALLVSWLMPYHTYPFWSFYHDYVALTGITLALLILLADRSAPSLTVPWAAWLPTGLATVVALDWVFARTPGASDALLPIGYLLAAAAAVTFGSNVARTSRDESEGRTRAFLHLSYVLVGAGVLSALITFTQYLGVDDRLGDFSVAIANDGPGAIRPYANLGQPNQLALILCWSLAGCWYLFQRGRVAGKVATVISLLLMASLALTQSKIAWLIAPVFVALVGWASRRIGLRAVSRLTLSFLVLSFIVCVLALPQLSAAIGAVTEGLDKRMETNGVRLVMILQGFYVGAIHPLLGVGWGQFGASQVDVAPGFGITQYAMHAHNFVANLCAETGLPVTVAVVASMVFWVWTRLCKRAIVAEELFVGLVLAAVGIHSMVEFPLWYAYVLVPVALLVGAVEGFQQRRPSATVPRTAATVMALCFALAITVVATDYRRVVQSFRALGYERVGLQYAAGSTDAPEWTAFGAFYRYIAFANLRPTIQMDPKEIAAAETLARRFGYAPVLMRMSMIYALNGRPDDALRTVDAIHHLYTQRYPETYQSWSQLASEYPEVLGKVFEKLPPP